MRRYNFSLCRKTTVSQLLPTDLIPKVKNFIMGLLHKKYPLGFIGSMDKTPLWMDMPGETTVTHRCECSAPKYPYNRSLKKIGLPFVFVLWLMAEN